MLRHNVLHLCCVNQSSLDDYFIVAASVCCASGGMLCSILVRNVRGVTVLYRKQLKMLQKRTGCSRKLQKCKGYYYFGRKHKG